MSSNIFLFSPVLSAGFIIGLSIDHHYKVAKVLRLRPFCPFVFAKRDEEHGLACEMNQHSLRVQEPSYRLAKYEYECRTIFLTRKMANGTRFSAASR